MIHQLKLEGADNAYAVVRGDKPYEVRVGDRGYAVGDLIYQVYYDKLEKKYIPHAVSEYAYLITYITDISTADASRKVLGIHKAIQSKIILNALIEQLRKTSSLTSITTYDKVYDKSVLLSITARNTLHFNHEGNLIDLNMNNIVWAEPYYSEGCNCRSIEYGHIGLPKIVTRSDFVDSHLYDMFMVRANEEEQYEQYEKLQANQS